MLVSTSVPAAPLALPAPRSLDSWAAAVRSGASMAPPHSGSKVAIEPSVVMPSSRWPSASNTGAPSKAFPIFQKANSVSSVAWTSMDPPLRETMLMRGDIDAITGFSFTSLLNLEARGVKAEDVVILPYADYGVKLYGNAIIASPKILKENPEAVKAFLAAFAKGMKDVIGNPAAAIGDVKARDGIINAELETRRLKLAIDTVINSANARAEGFGQVNGPRLSLMASQVSDAFNTKSRVNPDVVWNGSFLPTKAVLDDVWLAYNEELLKQNHFAVEAIDLKVRQGEFIAIVGPSGCGKSTFMKLTTGLKMPSM
eukprot:gene19729-39187_t